MSDPIMLTLYAACACYNNRSSVLSVRVRTIITVDVARLYVKVSAFQTLQIHATPRHPRFVI